ncbi:luciferin 4-monooxygenase-like [Zerene cesonia]|uniref:luciferin 4-monooxygenase-like n=1 Tax=Zerene cesonia TaxID=33412 RepID=UPI0018E568C7|nr:luciferin 4-monooxygenase-like [Zerene cesonia]
MLKMCHLKMRPDFHIGHVMMQSMRENSQLVSQVDIVTGQQETTGSVLRRSIQLAKHLRSIGLKPGDVLAISGNNHLDLFIPFYSALFNGLPIVGVDPNYKYDEIKKLFKITSPKVAFCEKSSYETYMNVTKDLGLNVKIIVFGNENNCFPTFVESNNNSDVENNFTVAEFDIDKIYVFLICTSGTTGKIKAAAFKHQAIADKMLHPTMVPKEKFRGTSAICISPINWISAYFNAIGSVYMGQMRIQSSIPDDLDYTMKIINQYKPITALVSPSLMATLLKRKDDVDLKCFDVIVVTGSKVYLDVLDEFQKCLKKGAIAFESYGQTELIGPTLQFVPGTPRGSSGEPHLLYSIKLVDPETGKEITEPNVPGEMWAKGPCFTEYYNDPEETANAFSEDGYCKTGDLLYRDENNFYYFVDRIKTLIKYRNFHVTPAELEEVIHSHKGVSDVCVIGIDDPEDGQRPVACVVKRNGHIVTAEEIKNLVLDKLSKSKELRGGVVFLKELPVTSTGKIARRKLLDIVLNSPRE